MSTPKNNKIRKVSTVNEHIPALRKRYTSTSTEEHKYLNDGLIDEITYYNNGNLSRQMRRVQNSCKVCSLNSRTIGFRRIEQQPMYTIQKETLQTISLQGKIKQ